ncbi:MAG: asparagine--tRNA ligase, partial [Myxococcales bacterium]|nr:asparagine--tRNA ligase [Myxococcales bacterium]
MSDATTHEAVSVSDLGQHVGKTVHLRGWLKNMRSSKKLHFLELRDGSGTVQCVVFQGDVSPEVFTMAGGLTQESSLQILGEVREHPKQKGVYEIGVKD